MTTFIYIICVTITVLLVLYLISKVTYTLRRAYLARRVNMEHQRKIIRWVFFGLVLWLILTAFLSIGGYYSNYKYLPPRIFLFGLFPPLVITFILIFSKSFLLLLRRIPPAWLMKVQGFRIVMELMLFAAFWGDIFPFQMTFVGFNFDIIAGITAFFAAKIFYRNGRFLRLEIVIWNVFGILLLLTIVFITTISTPAPFRIFLNEPSSAAIASFPFIWIPTFIVPFALAVHIFSIRQVFIKNLRPVED